MEGRIAFNCGALLGVVGMSVGARIILFGRIVMVIGGRVPFEGLGDRR
jgi:hypothetical protein